MPPLTPSETFRQNVWVAPFFEDDVPALVARIGEDRVLNLEVVLLRALPLVRLPERLQAPHLQHLRLVALAPLEHLHLVGR